MTTAAQRAAMARPLRVAVSAIVLLLGSGTVLFHLIEGWSWVDSFYFTGVSILTIGYGDLTPTHDLSKILTVILGFGAVSTAFYAFTTIGQVTHERMGALQDTLPFGERTGPVRKDGK